MYTTTVRYKRCILFVYKKYTNHASILIRVDSIFDSPEDQVETVNLLLHGTVHVHPVLEEINQD